MSRKPTNHPGNHVFGFRNRNPAAKILLMLKAITHRPRKKIGHVAPIFDRLLPTPSPSPPRAVAGGGGVNNEQAN